MGNVTQGNKPKEPVQIPPTVDIPGEIPTPEGMPPTGVTFNLPKPIGGDDPSGNGNTVVSTDAIKTFASNIELFEDPIRTALNGLGDVDIHAGAFYQAFHLASKIDDEGQLTDSTRTVLTKSLDALVKIREACNRIASEYDTAEELNQADATKFGELVNDASTVINSMGSGK
jgi:hypothetical protein